MILRVTGGGAEGLHDMLRRGEIGIADPEVDYIDALTLLLLFHLVNARKKVGREVIHASRIHHSGIAHETLFIFSPYGKLMPGQHDRKKGYRLRSGAPWTKQRVSPPAR